MVNSTIKVGQGFLANWEVTRGRIDGRDSSRVPSAGFVLILTSLFYTVYHVYPSPRTYSDMH